MHTHTHIQRERERERGRRRWGLDSLGLRLSPGSDETRHFAGRFSSGRRRRLEEVVEFVLYRLNDNQEETLSQRLVAYH